MEQSGVSVSGNDSVAQRAFVTLDCSGRYARILMLLDAILRFDALDLTTPISERKTVLDGQFSGRMITSVARSPT